MRGVAVSVAHRVGNALAHERRARRHGDSRVWRDGSTFTSFEDAHLSP
jgi:hypothetical protein